MSERKTIGKMAIRGKEYPVTIQVYDGNGTPSANLYLEGLTAGRYAHEVSSETWEALYAAGMAATANVKVAIPVMEVTSSGRYGGRGEGRRWRSGVVVGRHAGNGNILIRWEGIKTAEQEQERHHRRDKFRPMQAYLQKEYLELLTEQDRITGLIDAFEKRHAIEDLTQTVEQEIERVASETAND